VNRILLTAGLLLLASRAQGNPLTLAHFGGLRGDPVYTGAFALYWNPAALAEPGWDVALEGTLIERQATYDRDASLNLVPAELQAANSGVGKIGGGGVVPGIAGRYGRRVGPVDVGIGLGVFVENGGSGAWDKNLRAPSDAPGAIDGPQRWASISSSLLLVDLGLGLAVRHRRTGLSFGFTPILVVGNFSTVRARNIDASEQLVDAAGQPKEGRAYFSGDGLGFSAVVGVRWDVKPGWSVAATYQRGARVHLEGNLSVAFATLAPSPQRAYLNLPIADLVRVGASLRPTRWLTLRPMFECAIWSVLQEHVFSSARDNMPLLVIARRSADMYSGHLRADARINDRWVVMLGLGGEKSPTPSQTMEPGFGENDNLDVGAGARVALSHHVDLSATFLFQYFLPFTVTDSIQQPLTNGTYTDQRELVIVDLEVHGWRPSVR
jgi:long-chain fatty acid transport protein